MSLLHLYAANIGKLKPLIVITCLFSLPVWLISKILDWTLTNQDYIAGVLICIAIDHFIGSIYHAFKLRDFTFKRNAIGLINKLALCAGAAILFEVIHHTAKDATFIYEYLKTTTRLIVILYPAGSAFMNMSALTNGVFPPIGWTKRIASFNQDLDLQKMNKSGSVNTGKDSSAPSSNPE